MLENEKRTFTTYSETGMRVKLNKPIRDHKVGSDNRKSLIITYLDLHEDYSKVCELKGIKPLPYKEYKKFINHYFNGVAHLVHYFNIIFILPYGLGRFYLNKSKKIGYGVIHKIFPNYHTFQKHFYMKWDKESGYFRNRTMWRWKNSTSTVEITSSLARGKPSPITGEHGIRKGPIGHNFRGSDKWN